jgi:hypothetical protein
MILLNFSHPMTAHQRDQVEALTNAALTRALDVPTAFDEQLPFAPQLQELLAGIEMSPVQWQTEPILVVLPSLNFIAAALLAELHGRMGYFPPVVRMRPVAGSMPRQFEVAEILDLQTIREDARRKRL